MKQLINITSEPHQIHTIPLDYSDDDIKLTLRFYPTVQIWGMDIEWKTKKVYGLKLSLGVLHISSSNLPFDFAVTDNSGNGIDPFRVEDFSDGRCSIVVFDNKEMESLRGVPVEL